MDASSSASSSDNPHVLIIGAGIAGLTLAQALKTHGIPFTIFERDPEPGHRGRGWGLTIHWALDTFLSLLPQSIIDRLPETYVDPVAVDEGHKGNFLFFDLRNREPRWQVPSANRVRVSRERLRSLLMEGIDVKWSHSLIEFNHPSPSLVTAHFSNSAFATGNLLVGADGSHSGVRANLLSRNPPLAINYTLPVRFLGVNAIFPSSIALKAKELDPFFFQGGDPEADTFLWFSFLDTPSKDEREKGKGSWECQLSISYPFRSGFWGRAEPLEAPETNEGRLALMREFAEGWTEPFRSLVMGIPDETEVRNLPIQDFLPKMGMWDTADGRITMVGDAAHAMTIYRGEAANHGIRDVAVLLSHLLPSFKAYTVAQSSDATTNVYGLSEKGNAISAYEAEMIARTGPAVLTSRQACMDAHDYRNINEKSPLVNKRAIVFEE